MTGSHWLLIIMGLALLSIITSRNTTAAHNEIVKLRAEVAACRGMR